MSDDQDLTTVRDIMKSERTAMFTTVAPDGALHAAPMTTQEAEFDGDAWFLVHRESETVTNLQAQPKVNVTWAGATAWLSVAGTASVVEDAAKKDELWNEMTEAWFPDGKDDPAVVAVKVEGESAQYWDSPGRARMLVSMLKARVTGSTPDAGDSDTVDLT
ncbi:pyridoxamine 5'-phosphate oxidase family protein [Lapillicoccus jejuensis]|uniref:General stress protein 26 n=1 Tax=Lapillicoccus jejuensis TaxID=402171 RepID=A0A542DWX6_9MICO|nr:pyridoxamine 5'-phosphate oxidase family protein [Lapillicoccus jejuensis]TQJ07578.1 general stress protein 26 [Lapillicoccus jejuensis]